MTIKFPLFAFLLPTLVVTGCISTAESIIDGVAGAASSAGSNALFNANEEGCRADPALLAERAVGLEFYKEKSFGIASAQCDSKFNIRLDKATFSQNYDDALRKACFTELGSKTQTSFCSEATKNLQASTAPAKLDTQIAQQTSRVDYDVVALECDHEMFKRKRNVAKDARIDVSSSACTEEGICYSKDNLVDGNRQLSPSPSNSWANAPDSERRVDFVWETPVTNIEQVYLLTPHGVPIMNYTIEITTPGGQQYQMVRVLGNTEQKLCHRFNPIDVKSMFITGLGAEINQSQIFLNEVVVR